MLACAISLAAAGCGGTGEVKVSGSVVKGGTPLEGAVVGFEPADPKTGAPKGTSTDESGKFTTTLKPGKYTVLMSRKVDKNGNLPKSTERDPAFANQARLEATLHESLPAKFTTKDASPFTVEIPPEGKELPPFDVSK